MSSTPAPDSSCLAPRAGIDRRHWLHRLGQAGLLAALYPALSAHAQRTPQPAPSYPLFAHEPASHRLLRQQVQIGEQPDHRYQLFAAVPRQAPPPGGFPLLYLLDGNAVFDRLGTDELAQAAGLVLIGVGYDANERFDINGRTRDYTPPLPPGSTEPRRAIAGGAPRFERLLTGPLRAAAERELLAGVPLDPARRSLWGHSYGGLFTLYSLLQQPVAFRRYMALSPSTAWADQVLTRLARGMSRTSSAPADVLIMLGDREVRGQGRPGAVPVDPAAPAPGPNPVTLELAELLRRQRGWQVRTEVLTGLGHGATFMASLPDSFALAQAPLR